MRALDIVEYNDELSNIIDNKVENINAIDINDYFFTASKKVKSIAKPYHLCRNQNY